MTKRLTDKGPSPIALAKAMTPFWFETIHSYDGLVLAPVSAYQNKDGFKFCERVNNPQEAQFWSAYFHVWELGVRHLLKYQSRFVFLLVVFAATLVYIVHYAPTRQQKPQTKIPHILVL